MWCRGGREIWDEAERLVELYKASFGMFMGRGKGKEREGLGKNPHEKIE